LGGAARARGGRRRHRERRGAIGDLELVIREHSLDDDLLVAAGDSIFDGVRLEEFARLGLEKQAAVEAVYDVGDLEEVKRFSVITASDDGRIVAFEEKPNEPESTLAGIALYFYPRSTLPLIGRYLAEGNNPDQPGRLVEWMYSRTPVYVWQVPGRWYDIGSPETLDQADRELARRD
jgi:glucose-1-phosphate thymidylyltransferase